MTDKGYTAGMAGLLRSYLSGRQFRSQMGYVLSIPGIPEAGAPQEEVLSPLLYTTYTVDIPQTDTTMSLYTDDTAIAVASIQLRMISRYL